jgi:tetratricopeptide (TPR) repeat protein
MDAPQNNRRPQELSEEAKRRLLKQTHPDDSSDPFATDPNREIQELGKLALRVETGKVDYYIALGDSCAKLILSKDNRLRIFYVGKALMAYKKALDSAQNDIDRTMAKRAIDTLGDWIVDAACTYPSQRNVAVALWVTAEGDEDLPAPTVSRASSSTLIQIYQRKNFDPNETMYGEIVEEEATNAGELNPEALSDFSRTRGLDEDIYQSVEVSAAELSPLDETRAGVSLEVPLNQVTSQQRDEDTTAERIARPKSSVVQHEFAIGDLIEGRYEVADVRLGGMGVVYLCYDHDYREAVAIKSFQRRFLENEKAVMRFEHEAYTWIKLEKHPHIVQAKLVRNIGNRPHIILEHISGMEGMGADLRSWIDAKRLTLQQAMRFALHVALGMQHAQSKVPNLVHRDLKPGNIMVTHEAIAKITDFGLVRSVENDKDLSDVVTMSDAQPYTDERLTRIDAVVGTPPYMSPEQIRSRDVDIRADIYSFGIVLFEMLCWQHPFNAHGVKEWKEAHLHITPKFPSETPFRIPKELMALTLSCVEKSPHQRPQNWMEVVNKLSALFKEEFGETPIIEYENTALEVREMVNKGYSLTELGRYQDALEAYNQAIESEPDYAWAWGRKGRTLRLLERYDEALDCYTKALELNPKDAWSWNGKGIVLDRLRRLDDALQHFEQATKVEPSYVWYWYNRGDTLKEMNRYEDALKMIERGLAIDPTHVNSWAKLGQLYRTVGNHRESLKAYEKAIQLQPDYAWAHNGHGLTLKALKRLDEAILAFRKAIRYQPDAIWNWYNLTETLVDTDRYLEALEPAQQTVKLDPNNAHAWGKLGQVYRKLNRLEDALEAYDKAVQLAPDFDWAINGKGLVLEHLQRYEVALACYQKASELKPES